MEIFGYQFFQNALIGSLFASLACGIVGTYVVARRLVFISGGISHSSFGGIGLGLFAGVNPTITAFLFAIASALGVQWLSHGKEIREDSAIAVVWILGMAVGILFSFLSPNYTGELSTYMFGNILTMGRTDIIMLAIISFFLILFTVTMYRPLLSVAFDSEFATSRNLPVKALESAMMVFIAITIAATLRLVGVVLVISMLTVPQMTAMIFTNNYKKIILLSIGICYTSNITGLLLSYWWDIPSGAAIIISSVVVYLLCLTLRKTSGRLLLHDTSQ